MVTEDLQRAYETLELDPAAASLEDVRATYHDLVKIWHPDRYQHESLRLRQRADEKLKAITAAYHRIGGAAEDGPGGRAKSADPIPMDFGERWGYVDPGGQTAIYPDFLAARPFSGGLAAVRPVDKWGYVDRTGTFRVTPLYEDCSDFSEGLAAVKWYGRWGYIDSNGQFAVQPRFQHADIFQEGRARVRLGARWGTINRGGDIEFDVPVPAGQITGSVK